MSFFSDLFGKSNAKVGKRETVDVKREKAARIRRERDEAAKGKAEILRQAELESAVAPEKSKPTAVHTFIQKIGATIEDENTAEAIEMLQEVTQDELLQQLDINYYSAMINYTFKNEKWAEARMVLEKSLVAHPDDANDRRLRLGKILLGSREVELCERNLAHIDRKALSPQEDKLFRQLVLQLRHVDSQDD